MDPIPPEVIARAEQWEERARVANEHWEVIVSHTHQLQAQAQSGQITPQQWQQQADFYRENEAKFHVFLDQRQRFYDQWPILDPEAAHARLQERQRETAYVPVANNEMQHALPAPAEDDERTLLQRNKALGLSIVAVFVLAALGAAAFAVNVVVKEFQQAKSGAHHVVTQLNGDLPTTSATLYKGKLQNSGKTLLEGQYVLNTTKNTLTLSDVKSSGYVQGKPTTPQLKNVTVICVPYVTGDMTLVAHKVNLTRVLSARTATISLKSSSVAAKAPIADKLWEQDLDRAGCALYDGSKNSGLDQGIMPITDPASKQFTGQSAGITYTLTMAPDSDGILTMENAQLVIAGSPVQEVDEAGCYRILGDAGTGHGSKKFTWTKSPLELKLSEYPGPGFFLESSGPASGLYCMVVNNRSSSPAPALMKAV